MGDRAPLAALISGRTILDDTIGPDHHLLAIASTIGTAEQSRLVDEARMPVQLHRYARDERAVTRAHGTDVLALIRPDGYLAWIGPSSQ